MARAGDVEALWQLLLTAPPTMISWEETFRLLARALEVRARQDPAEFASALFAQMLSMTAYFILRTHFFATRLIAGHDASTPSRTSADVPREVIEWILPRLIELQAHLGELTHLQAGVARLWELTRGKRIENDREEREASQGNGRRGTSPRLQGNGRPLNAHEHPRVAELNGGSHEFTNTSNGTAAGTRQRHTGGEVGRDQEKD